LVDLIVVYDFSKIFPSFRINCRWSSMASI